jgi:hypothetical protein
MHIDFELNSEVGGFLTNSFGEHYLHAVNRNTFNSVGATAVFQRHFPKSFWDEDHLNIIIGTDSGLLIDYVARHGVPEGNRFLFIELDGIQEQVKERFVETLPDPRMVLATLAEWKSKAIDLSFESYLYINKVNLLLSVGASDAFLPDYRDLHRKVKNDMDLWAWSLKGQLSSAEFIQCQLANIAENRTPALLLKHSFPGKTAVLMAGGPSLDDLIPWVKVNRDKLVVVAVSRVARRLIQEQLTPDIVCTIDPTSLSFDVSKEMLTFDPGVLLVTAYHANPLLIGQWRGPSVYLGSRYPWQSEREAKNLSVEGPTVSNTAIALLMEMGFAQIVLGGLDLCYKQDGSRYAVGSNESKVGPALGHVGRQLETNAGYMADTIDDFVQSVHTVGRQAVRARQSGCQLINPAPGAAKIPHVEHLLVENISLTELDEVPGETFRRLLPLDDTTHRLNDYCSVEKELGHTANKLKKIRTLAKEAIHCNDGLFGRNGVKQDFKHKIKMDKIEKRLNREFAALSVLVKQYGIRQFLRFIRPDLDKEWQDQEIEDAGRVYYEAYREGSEQLLRVIEETRQRVASRREEENAVVNLDALETQWREDNEPGRALVWQHNHPEQYAGLDSAAKTILDGLTAEFTAQIAETETRHLARCRSEAGLEGVPSKVVLLFSHKDSVGLRQLVEGLENNPRQDTDTLLHFAKGFLAELEGRAEDALTHYQHIPEGPLLEDALCRISALSLGREDYQSAQLALQCLSQISVSYLPQYAELLRITGQTEQAAAVYADYLEQVPNDIYTLLRLGKLYQDQGIDDGARWAYGYILERDPDNPVALKWLESLEKRISA